MAISTGGRGGSTSFAEKRSAFKTNITKDSTDVLGQMLVKEGAVTKSHLAAAEEIQKKLKDKVPISVLLVRMGHTDEDYVIKFVSKHLAIPPIDMDRESVDPKLVKAVPFKMAKEQLCMPLRLEGKQIRVAFIDPTNTGYLEVLNSKLNMPIKPTIISEESLKSAYRKYYNAKEDELEAIFTIDIDSIAGNDDSIDFNRFDNMGDILSEAEKDFEVDHSDEVDDGQQLYNQQDAGIIKLVNGILIRAIEQGASDIHIEPYEKTFQVRYRVDGSLFRALNVPVNMKAALVSRVKIMANLNIAEKRRTQDGRIKLKLGKTKAIDFRVSVLPTLFGESIVLRLLDQTKLQINLSKLGFTDAMLKTFLRLIEKPQGLVLVTGPTGSGKTNTLYSAINILNKPDVKILTAEDPVEFNFTGINQVNVKPDVGLTFASALRAFLRQDPEIILVGEIRDMETAEIALKASMTGHMVFSTLHTNDCPSTIGRLIDIGIPGYMISSALTLVLAQRLLRRICTNCKTEVKNLDKDMLIEEGVHPDMVDKFKVFEGRGCKTCNGTGYKGRVGVYEMMEATNNVREAITSQVAEGQLRKIAIKDGYKTLRDDALHKVNEGITSLKEAFGRTVVVKEARPAYLLNPDELSFNDGDIILKEGNTDKNFYQLIQGSLIIRRSGNIVGEISQPGEYFGEMSSLLDQPRSATIKSRGKSVVKIFPGDKLKETIENYPDIAFSIIRSLVKRVEALSEHLSTQNNANK